MFSALLIAQDPIATRSIEQLADESGLVAIQKTLSTYPPNYELTVLLNTHDPDIVFMDLSGWEGASAAASMIHSLNPEITIVGFGAGWGSNEVHVRTGGDLGTPGFAGVSCPFSLTSSFGDHCSMRSKTPHSSTIPFGRAASCKSTESIFFCPTGRSRLPLGAIITICWNLHARATVPSWSICRKW